jgi:hypothetical protein
LALTGGIGLTEVFDRPRGPLAHPSSLPPRASGSSDPR